MRSPRPSRITTGSLTHLIFKETVALQMLDVQLLTQDGGNCSDLMELSSGILRMIRFLMFKVELMERTRTLLFTQLMENSINSGILCMSINGRVNLRKVSSMKDLVSMLKEISMSKQNCQVEDILI
jgi:hypothetical protein